MQQRTLALSSGTTLQVLRGPKCAETLDQIIELEKGSSKDEGEAKEGEAQSGGKDSSNEA